MEWVIARRAWTWNELLIACYVAERLWFWQNRRMKTNNENVWDDDELRPQWLQPLQANCKLPGFTTTEGKRAYILETSSFISQFLSSPTFLWVQSSFLLTWLISVGTWVSFPPPVTPINQPACGEPARAFLLPFCFSFYIKHTGLFFTSELILPAWKESSENLLVDTKA